MKRGFQSCMYLNHHTSTAIEIKGTGRCVEICGLKTVIPIAKHFTVAVYVKTIVESDKHQCRPQKEFNKKQKDRQRFLIYSPNAAHLSIAMIEGSNYRQFNMACMAVH